MLRATAPGLTSPTPCGAARKSDARHAQAVELDAMLSDDKPRPGRDATDDATIHPGLEIENPTAALTDKVIVPGGVTVIAAEPPAVQVVDQPFLREELQVPVDRPQADPGEPPAHRAVNPLGGGMGIRPPYDLQDEPSLICQPPATPLQPFAKLGLRGHFHIQE